ncbi:MAG: NAD(P)H-dependent oxidoreductase subunit E [Spirochaetaceae bacterium]|nr:MAG: NAD(P)H-dependent oxidoreductase subunit E [Spirochaetaceae bacterium]
MSLQTTTIDIAHLLERYPSEDGQEALMGLLQDIQEDLGYLPVEALEKVSRHLKIPLSHIYGVISFYAQFSLTPRGKNIIKMCMGTACHIRGGQMVLDEIRSYLNLNGTDTTEDRLFSLEVVRCLGTCFLAPVMMIGNRYYGKLTTAKVRKILKSYQR